MTRAVEIPNHELAREKLMPRTEKTEKFFRSSCVCPTVVGRSQYSSVIRGHRLVARWRIPVMDLLWPRDVSSSGTLSFEVMFLVSSAMMAII